VDNGRRPDLSVTKKSASKLDATCHQPPKKFEKFSTAIIGHNFDQTRRWHQIETRNYTKK
jgi:hypothetical protein